jgi:hypothetical protein
VTGSYSGSAIGDVDRVPSLFGDALRGEVPAISLPREAAAFIESVVCHNDWRL